MHQLKIPSAAPMNLRYRVSSESVWPLRGADGKTFAERKKDKEAAQKAGKESQTPRKDPRN